MLILQSAETSSNHKLRLRLQLQLRLETPATINGQRQPKLVLPVKGSCRCCCCCSCIVSAFCFRFQANAKNRQKQRHNSYMKWNAIRSIEGAVLLPYTLKKMRTVWAGEMQKIPKNQFRPQRKGNIRIFTAITVFNYCQLELERLCISTLLDCSN